VDTTRIAWVRQHGRHSTGEPKLLSDIFEQDYTGLRRQATSSEVKLYGFSSDRGQMSWYRLQMGCHLSGHRINT
jgi:hypothetical protein